MEIVLHILTHSFEDTIKMIPLIVLTYIILDIYERNSDINTKINYILNSKTGPIFGALIGCIPQCGFAFLAATLFVNKLVSAGTMVAIFIATSDEALPLLIANPSEYKSLFLLIVIKIIFAIAAGYTLDFILQLAGKKQEIEDDEDEELEISLSDPSCNCGSSMFGNVIGRSLRILGFVFSITTLFSLIIEFIGETQISSFLASTYIIQPFITALLGFIPNCAISIIMCELFVVHGLSLGALIAGLSVNAGMGSLVLIKEHKDKKETFFILGFMYITSVIVGLLLTVLL